MDARSGTFTLIKGWDGEVLQDHLNSLTLRECQFALWFLERIEMEDKIRKNREEAIFYNFFRFVWNTLAGRSDEEDEVALYFFHTQKLKKANFGDIARMRTIEQMIVSYRSRMEVLYLYAEDRGNTLDMRH